MTFAHPLWFSAMIVLPLLAIFYGVLEKKSGEKLSQMVAPKLRGTLLRGVHRGKRLLRFVLTLGALAAIITALARPQMGFETQEIKRKGRDVVVAIDTSRSMLADDVSPNRLARSKLAVQDLLRILEGDRIALVAFAGTAFLQAPLTIDYGAVQASLEELDAGIIPKGGTNLSEAIKVSLAAFGKAEGANKALVLFTDGEELDADGLKAAAAAKEAGVRIFTVGVGSSEGAMIPIQENGESTFVRDESGQFVKTKLDESRLKEIADAADGFYVHLENSSNAVQTLLDDGIRKLEEREGSQLTSRRPIERYQWPLGLGIVLFMLAQSLSDRRRTVGKAMLALVVIAQATSAQAWEIPAFGEKGKRTYNEGTTAYRAKKFDDALKRFSDASASADPDVRKKAEYNAANTLFERGAGTLENNRAQAIKDWKESLAHYNESLKIDPKYPEAIYNRKVVEDLLKEEEKKKEEQEKRDEKDKEKNQEQQQEQQKQAKNDQQKSDDQKQGSGKSDSKDKQEQQPGKNGKKDPDQLPQPGQNQQPDRKNGDQKPDPAPTPGEKKEGELKAADNGEKKDEPEPKESEGAQAVAKPEEERDGEMSKDQAQALIEAMQGEEQRVDLREQMNEPPVGKDW